MNQYSVRANSLPTNVEGTKRAHIDRYLRSEPQNFQSLQPNNMNGAQYNPQQTQTQASTGKMELVQLSQSSRNMNSNDFKLNQPAVLVLDIPQSVIGPNRSISVSHSPKIKLESDQSNLSNLNATDRKEDPHIARKNIEEFNALARQNLNAPYSNSLTNQMQQGNSSGEYPLDSSAHSANQIQLADNPQITQPQDPSFAYQNQTMKQEVIQPFTIGDAQFCMPITGQPTIITSIHPNGTSRPCRIQGCNDVAVSKRPYCARHSGNRTCEHPGCTKCAQGATRFCIAHGGGRRCTFPGCDKGARDKFFCAAHGGGRRCTAEGCTKSAVGGSKLCTSHGGGRRCAIDGCQKSAQSSTKFCVKHGGGKKCAHESCDKVARGRTLYCAAHGGGIRCKLEGCNRVAIGKKQLCRSHGGGTTSKTKRKKNTETHPPSLTVPPPSYFVTPNSQSMIP